MYSLGSFQQFARSYCKGTFDESYWSSPAVAVRVELMGEMGRWCIWAVSGLPLVSRAPEAVVLLLDSTTSTTKPPRS